MSIPAPTSSTADPAAALAAVLDWWRTAGVDHAFADAPRTWLAAPAATDHAAVDGRGAAGPTAAKAPDRAVPPPPPPVAATPVDRIAGLDTLPATLAEFHAWWLAEPSLDSGMVTGRIPPRGAEGAALMVLTDHPEAEDGDTLLSGPQGRLLDAMLAAMGLAADQVYRASCLPRHMPMPDWAERAAAGLGEVVRHHVALARPQRLLVFGRNILPLLDNDPPNSGEPLREFNHEGAKIPVLVAPALGALAIRPRSKAGLWQAWLDWTTQD